MQGCDFLNLSLTFLAVDLDFSGSCWLVHANLFGRSYVLQVERPTGSESASISRALQLLHLWDNVSINKGTFLIILLGPTTFNNMNVDVSQRQSMFFLTNTIAVSKVVCITLLYLYLFSFCTCYPLHTRTLPMFVGFFFFQSLYRLMSTFSRSQLYLHCTFLFY